jgi:opacity protein-like surface antigen
MKMQKKLKIFITTVTLAFTAVMPSYSAELKDLQNGVVDFSEKMAKSLPFNSSLGLNWSDAYIGKLFPSVPPHFGLGGSFSFTTMDLDALKTLAGHLGYQMPFTTERLFFPAYTLEGRLGGFFLPFDIGVKFGMLSPVEMWGTSAKMEYTIAGMDIRYAVLDGKSKIFLPNLSLGVGFNYLKGGIRNSIANSQTLIFDTNKSISLDKPEINLLWDTFSLDFKVQVSKNFLIITPYAGIGASYAWSKTGYKVNAEVTYNGNNIATGIDEVKSYLDSAGLNDMDISSSGISTIIKDKRFGLRAFGGLSLDLMVFKLDITGLYNFLDKNYGGSAGFRFQL